MCVLHSLPVQADDDDTPDPNPPTSPAIGPLRRALARYFQARVRETSDVEDLVQDVFARIAGRTSTQPIEHLESYVFQTAASVLTDRSRRRRVRQAESHVPFDPDRHGGQSLDPYRALSGKEDLHRATAALLELPPRTRAIFVLSRLEGMTYREIASHVGISVSAVEKHMMRAIEHLTASFGNSDDA